jgi:hypothetical protein
MKRTSPVVRNFADDLCKNRQIDERTDAYVCASFILSGPAPVDAVHSSGEVSLVSEYPNTVRVPASACRWWSAWCVPVFISK